MSTFTDQERYDREFDRYMVMYKNGDIGNMPFGEFYARQATTNEDLSMQKLIDSELERNLLAMNCNRV